MDLSTRLDQMTYYNDVLSTTKDKVLSMKHIMDWKEATFKLTKHHKNINNQNYGGQPYIETIKNLWTNFIDVNDLVDLYQAWEFPNISKSKIKIWNPGD